MAAIRHPISESGGIAIRPMTRNDIPGGMRLSALAGWNQTEADWELFLAANAEGCFVAVHNGQPVGTVATITYAGWLAWIGLVLVDPQFRKMGIGSLLMDAALDYLKDCPSIKLDASAAGKRLYDTMSFVDEYELQRLTHGSVPVLPHTLSADIFQLTEATCERILELDRKVFGVDRRNVINALLKNAPESAFYLERKGRVCGYCLGRSGSKFHQIGPVIAENAEDAKALMQTALRKFVGRPVLLDVPSAQPELLAWLESQGFVSQRTFARMFRNGNGSPGIPAQYFAIAGPELG